MAEKRLITFNGKTQHLAAWEREVGLPFDTLRHRLKKWGVEKALDPNAKSEEEGLLEQGLKRCIGKDGCNRILPLSNFSRYKANKTSGRKSLCKVCTAKVEKARSTPESRERSRKQQKEYYARPEIKARKSEYQKKYLSIPKVKERRQQQIKKHNAKPEVKARTAAVGEIWRENNKEELARKSKIYRDKPENKVQAAAKAKERNARPEVKARTAAVGKIYREKNKDAIKARADKYYKEHKEEKAAYHQKNKEYIAARGKIYREQNKEKLSRLNKIWREDNKEELARKSKIYRDKPENKARVSKYLKNYRRQNAEVVFVTTTANRLAKYMGIEFTLEEAALFSTFHFTREELRAHMDNELKYTDMTWESEELEQDHVIPKARWIPYIIAANKKDKLFLRAMLCSPDNNQALTKDDNKQKFERLDHHTQIQRFLEPDFPIDRIHNINDFEWLKEFYIQLIQNDPKYYWLYERYILQVEEVA